MFKVVAEPRRRRVWTPRGLAASFIFHLLVVAGLAAAARNRSMDAVGGFYDPYPFEPPRLAPAEPRLPPLPPQPTSVAVHTPLIDARPERPPEMQRVLPSPDFKPFMPDLYSDGGATGTLYGTPDSVVPAAAGEITSDDDNGSLEILDLLDGDELSVDTRPELANRHQAELILRRSYPPPLRDAGMMGRTTVQLIINRDGRVEPGSARVRESTDRAFNAAAIRAVEQFRFKPAMVRGHPVAVLVTIPIDWRVEN